MSRPNSGVKLHNNKHLPVCCKPGLNSVDSKNCKPSLNSVDSKSCKPDLSSVGLKNCKLGLSSVESKNCKAGSVCSGPILPECRRLKLDPRNHLYFPYEPGKQVKSAIRVKNISKSHVAFKFQTTEPKSCFMRPPGGVLAPGEGLIATVFKFVEHPENNEMQLAQQNEIKFKIMSLKVKEATEYASELFDEQNDQVIVERILRVVFLDTERPSPSLEKLKLMLDESEAALEAQKKPPADIGTKLVGEGLVIDEWKVRREKYLAQKRADG